MYFNGWQIQESSDIMSLIYGVCHMKCEIIRYLLRILSTGLLPDTQICGLRMRRECRERFSRPPRVSDPGMYRGTCVTHVPWCVPGSLNSGFLCSRWREKGSRHFRRMRNPQFPVSGKRSMVRHPLALAKLALTHLILNKIWPPFRGRYFQCIFVNEKFVFWLKCHWIFLPKCTADSSLALVQILAWWWTDDKTLSESMLMWFTDVYMRHYSEIISCGQVRPNRRFD